MARHRCAFRNRWAILHPKDEKKSMAAAMSQRLVSLTAEPDDTKDVREYLDS